MLYCRYYFLAYSTTVLRLSPTAVATSTSVSADSTVDGTNIMGKKKMPTAIAR